MQEVVAGIIQGRSLAPNRNIVNNTACLTNALFVICAVVGG